MTGPTCVQLPPASCQAAGGLVTSCSSTGCAPQVGSCCVPDVTGYQCILTSNATCSAVGLYRGAASCSASPCPAPAPAPSTPPGPTPPPPPPQSCCHSSGSVPVCNDGFSLATCNALAGTHRSSSSCAAASCPAPAPVPGCCYQSGGLPTCSPVSGAACTTLGGSDVADCSLCAASSCCFGTPANCIDGQSAALCAALTNSNYSSVDFCAERTCGLATLEPTGACCTYPSSGTQCTELTPTVCADVGGAWSSQSCLASPCARGCCLGGSCTEALDKATCDSLYGFYFRLSCSALNCPSGFAATSPLTPPAGTTRPAQTSSPSNGSQTLTITFAHTGGSQTVYHADSPPGCHHCGTLQRCVPLHDVHSYGCWCWYEPS